MKIIKVSAPGKIILSGEHAVVYGKPALISSINLRLNFSIWEGTGRINEEIVSFISNKVKEFLRKENIIFRDRKFNYGISSDIPIGKGLGSSAALSVASAAAFLEFYTGKKFSKEDINLLAYEIEQYFHGNPSGADNSASSFGGLIFYRKETEFLKNISVLPFTLAGTIKNSFCFIDSGEPKESTKEMVSYVRNKYDRNYQRIEKILSDMERVTKQLTVSIKINNKKMLKESIRENEDLLERLGVVSSFSKSIIREIEKKGGTAKICGGGGMRKGTGIILAFHEDKTAVDKSVKTFNLKTHDIKLDTQGFRREN